jgi:hypothetical protein
MALLILMPPYVWEDPLSISNVITYVAIAAFLGAAAFFAVRARR